LSLGEQGLRVGAAFESFVESYAKTGSPSSEHLAQYQQRIASHVFSEIPAVVPRDATATLMLRERLSDELEEFRDVVRSSALTLAETGSQQQITRVVHDRFLAPLNKLRRQLKNPGRDVAKKPSHRCRTFDGCHLCGMCADWVVSACWGCVRIVA
jgi:hypothetical protein